MLSQAIINRIRARNSKKDGTLKKLKKPPAWLFPLSPERQYRKALYELTFEIRKVVNEQLLPKIPAMLLAATLPNPEPVLPKTSLDSKIRKDDFLDFLNDTMRVIKILLLPIQNKTIQTAKGIGIEIALFNQKQFEKITNSVLGIDIFLEEPWLINQLKIFADQNAQLINSLVNVELDRVSGHVQRGLQEGSTYDSIAKDIQESFGITRRHAKLIARDQTSKLNGSITKLRQQEVGISQYRWQTSGDERVRQSHKVMDGKKCRWDDPTVYLDEATGKWLKRSSIGGTEVHTSQDINCRCIPIPIIEGFFDG